MAKQEHRQGNRRYISQKENKSKGGRQFRPRNENVPRLHAQ